MAATTKWTHALLGKIHNFNICPPLLISNELAGKDGGKNGWEKLAGNKLCQLVSILCNASYNFFLSKKTWNHAV